MKRIILSMFLGAASISFVFASVCVDISSNLSPKAESPAVLLVQQFLSEKGFLTVKPNGYFGPSTIKAAKAYQKSKGLPQSGAVFPMTRAAIKKDSCLTSSTSTPSTISSQTATSSIKVATTTSQGSNTVLNQAIPPTVILSADPSPVSYGGNSVIKYISHGATSCRMTHASDEAWVGVNLSDIIQVSSVKTPETYSVTCKGVGGTVTKSITIAVLPKPVTADATSDDFWNYPIPRLSTLDTSLFIVNSTTTSNLIIRGTNFSTSSNIIIGTLQGTNKTFILGTSTSADTKIITLSSDFIRKKYPTGNSSEEYLPAGYYLITVKTKGGESNSGHMSLKSVMTSSVSGSPDVAILPKTTRVKVGTVTLSSSILALLQSITFTLSGATGVIAKTSNITLKDLSTGVSSAGGPSFSFTKQDLLENQSKIYELYADFGDILSKDAGNVTFSGTLTITDYITKTPAHITIPAFTVSVSY
jgi:peptidoglycan hydrolase-like protein with peptidoglycan-binding domain